VSTLKNLCFQLVRERERETRVYRGAALTARAGIVFKRTSELALATAPKLAGADAETNAKLLEQEQHLHMMSHGV
jgi:hypothetical protein